MNYNRNPHLPRSLRVAGQLDMDTMSFHQKHPQPSGTGATFMCPVPVAKEVTLRQPLAQGATVDILAENTELDIETLPDTTRKLWRYSACFLFCFF